MKNKKLLFLMLMTLILILTSSTILVGCGGSQGSGSSGLIDQPPGVETPSKNDWSNVGLGNEFGVDVKGTLTANYAVDNEIEMKWINSDEQSLDKIIEWVRSKGYTSINGIESEKETLEEGMITYSAQKTNSNEKNIMVEVTYMTKDFSVMGQTLKAGDLYFSAYEVESGIPPLGGDLAKWPSEDIRKILGVDLPEYKGTVLMYMSAPYNIGAFLGITITIQGAVEQEFNQYIANLAAAGFSECEEYDGYSKQLSDESLLVINACVYNYSMGMFNAFIVKEGGQYSSWSEVSKSLSKYQSAGIPAYDGGKSFDVIDITDAYGLADTIKQTYSYIIQAYELAVSLGQDVSDIKEEYEQALIMLEKVELISVHMVTVYKTNETEKDAYIQKILSSPSNSDNKFEEDNNEYSRKYFNGEDYIMTISVSEVSEDKLTIQYSNMPAVLLDDPDNGGGGNNNDKLYDEVSFEDLPENLKLKYKSTGFGATLADLSIIKIGDNWLIEENLYGTISKYYLKKTSEGWEEYLYNEESWVSLGSVCTELGDNAYLQNLDIMFDNQYVDGLTNTGKENVAGKECDVYVDSYEGTEEKYYITAEGFVLQYDYKMSYAGMNYETQQVILLWDETVKEFGMEVPQ